MQVAVHGNPVQIETCLGAGDTAMAAVAKNLSVFFRNQKEIIAGGALGDSIVDEFHGHGDFMVVKGAGTDQQLIQGLTVRGQKIPKIHALVSNLAAIEGIGKDAFNRLGEGDLRLF
jgi:hypothetical protein